MHIMNQMKPKNLIPCHRISGFPQPGSAVAVGVQEVAEKISEVSVRGLNHGTCLDGEIPNWEGFCWEIH